MVRVNKSLEKKYQATGKKLDMGKTCVRSKKLDDLPLEAVAKEVGRFPPVQYIKDYEASRKN